MPSPTIYYTNGTPYVQDVYETSGQLPPPYGQPTFSAYLEGQQIQHHNSHEVCFIFERLHLRLDKFPKNCNMLYTFHTLLIDVAIAEFVYAQIC